ncbi:MAG: ABC transporter ATP-binding protein [Acidimicrobiia bacterium]|nr:ABC transporter ATP-binding protein [Acidimicrobiia bacterium]
MTDTPLLEGRGVTKRFGGLEAVKNVDFSIFPGEVVGLIGPNGSGKTTLFDCLSRVQNINSGSVTFNGIDITRRKPHHVAHLGMARTFQVIRVYRKLTVLENMLVSRQWAGERLLNQLKRAHPDVETRAHGLIEFLELGHLTHAEAGTLSGGQQRLLEIGMALMPDPDLLLLDEATSGVNPTLIETIKDRIRRLNEAGKTFLLVEHNMRFISDLCERVYVLNQGEKLAAGTPAEIMENEAVIEAYFGA